ncbi:hypothetical protein AB3R30_05720 [Leptolyngbyaceae cyanobacterium UHCC 1019]
MQRKANKTRDEDLEQDLTDEDFKAMEDHLSAMEDHLFNAGVGILQAAKTQEELFNTSIEAIQEALEPGSTGVEEPRKFLSMPSDEQPQEISLTAIWERLGKIEHRLDYLIEHLISVPVTNPSKLQKPPETIDLVDSEWTEKSLKKAYKTLATVRSQLGITAKTWRSAVNEANSLKV